MRSSAVQPQSWIQEIVPDWTGNPAKTETERDMSKAQKRGNRELKKPKSIKKVELAAVSPSLIKTAITSSEQPKKKR